MILFNYSKIFFTLMTVHSVTSVFKSAMVNMESIGHKYIRNLGVIERVLNKIGFIMCARQCEKSNQCKGFNYMRSDLFCELLISIGDNTNSSDVWQFVNVLSILKDKSLSTQSRGKICKSSGSNIQLYDGSFVCQKNDKPIDCDDSGLMLPEALSGVYRIKPKNGENSLNAFCDMATDGSRWTVIQKRKDGSVDFDIDWNTYRKGFGNSTGEHWIGNDALFALTSSHNYILRIEMIQQNGEYRYAMYSQFSVADAFNNFKLTITGYSGNTEDALGTANGKNFSTKDRDNDLWHYGKFSDFYGGGWWFGLHVPGHLNVMYGSCTGCVYVYWPNTMIAVTSVTMKIKRKNEQ